MVKVQSKNPYIGERLVGRTERIGHILLPFPGFDKSFALLSEAKADYVNRAVIFVHGFSGSARGTFTDFLSLVDSDLAATRWWETADLFFYHYQWDSIFRKVSENRIGVTNFIESIVPSPPKALFNVAGNDIRASILYEEVFLVGHSEGGLILRSIILDAADADERLEDFKLNRIYKPMNEPEPIGLEIARLRLFAPAIGGESVSGLLGIICNLPFISVIPAAAGAKTTMQPQSTTVAATRSGTEQYSDYLKMPCFRAHILWASKDHIVTPEKYRRDIEYKQSPADTTHTSVCKPTGSYILPISFVENGATSGKA